MRVTILTNYFPPEGGSGARLVGEFAAYLAHCGDDVEVWCPRPSYHLSDGPGVPDVTVRHFGARLPTALPHRLRRAAEHLLRPLLLAGAQMRTPDVIYVWLPPPGMLPVAAWLRRRLNRPVVGHVQDLFPFNVQDTGVVRWDSAIAAMDRWARPYYRALDHVVVHAPSARSYFSNLGRPCTWLPNWLDVPAELPERGPGLLPRQAVFAGVMGLAQDVDTVLSAAALLKEDRTIRFSLAGDGVARPGAVARIDREGLSNVTLQPMLRPDAYRRLVADADVFLVTLRSSVRYPVIPSKIGDGLAAGVPVLASLPAGDGAHLVRASQGGIVVPAGDARHLAQALDDLCVDEAGRRTMGRLGHSYAREHLERTKVLPQLRQVLLRTA